ncbi:GNAT family N-acetyltransferase [Roseobacter sinensis]|uniref:GNAT family N-acetyltransferase n=1 Tax=Roseobacter sinensis TaxID=2931391 RepID=A0ABT3BG67_9RHOB|nr:GNAT family N-acetyltransferase [Roseobacter sp. WL0113]MCV3272099.1 GNAT family N-acetyltransferase [Roseobacter sp. WL0113]
MSEHIQTRRLVLRPFRDADARRVAELVGNLDVARWLTRVPHPYGVDDALGFFGRHAGDKLVLAVTQSDVVIGCCSIRDELGYWLGQPYWGLGYAFEAASALVGAYFATHRAPLQSGYMLGNAASARVLSKLGFAPTRIDMAACQATGTPVKLQKVTLSRETWQGRA